MKILVTGTAGFIGYHLALVLLQKGYEVIGVDNINDYYDVGLKYGRLEACGIDSDKLKWGQPVTSSIYPKYQFIKLNLEDKKQLEEIFAESRISVVVNLAAQAGVRYSIENPDVYVQSNVVGFLNILEASRKFKVEHLVYASSSSVYGLNEQVPFSTKNAVEHPVSLYAATKKANELMAHSYSHLYKLPTTGLRFFTVYGPWGRPDMAYSIFSEAIVNGKPIQVFNNGNMKRDFTYIDDVVNGIMNVIERPAIANVGWSGSEPDCSSSSAPYKVYNIGNNKPVNLMRFIRTLEQHLGIKAVIQLREMQQGDVVTTWADIDDSIASLGYMPATSIEDGLSKFASWYKSYYEIGSYADLRA